MTLFHPTLTLRYQARIHDLTTGRFLLHCNVQAQDLHEAENAAINHAALALRCRPHDMEVRHLHQCQERRQENAGMCAA